MSLEYIRDAYNIPAYKGKRIKYIDPKGKKHIGSITSGDGEYLKIKMDDTGKVLSYHPLWNIEYLEEG